MLAVFVKEVLDEAKLKVSDMDAVALSGGPGSYTGLRIGASTSKGLCFGGDIPLISVNTLLVIAAMAKSKYNCDYDLIVPMIDARRMEVYTMITDAKLNKLSEVEAKIITEESFAEYKGRKLLFCGNGAPKCKEVLACDGFVSWMIFSHPQSLWANFQKLHSAQESSRIWYITNHSISRSLLPQHQRNHYSKK